jgi:polyisoprenoid-binding protein YceI
VRRERQPDDRRSVTIHLTPAGQEKIERIFPHMVHAITNDWTIDTSHTQIQFSVRHMMITKVRGNFEKFSGTVDLVENHPANTTVNIRVETAIVNTREPNRDNHLRSPDFFNSAVYPSMTFKSTQVDVTD